MGKCIGTSVRYENSARSLSLGGWPSVSTWSAIRAALLFFCCCCGGVSPARQRGRPRLGQFDHWMEILRQSSGGGEVEERGVGSIEWDVEVGVGVGVGDGCVCVLSFALWPQHSRSTCSLHSYIEHIQPYTHWNVQWCRFFNFFSPPHGQMHDLHHDGTASRVEKVEYKFFLFFGEPSMYVPPPSEHQPLKQKSDLKASAVSLLTTCIHRIRPPFPRLWPIQPPGPSVTENESFCLVALPLDGEVAEPDGPLLALLAPVPHHDAGAVDHFPSVALAVQDPQPRPSPASSRRALGSAGLCAPRTASPRASCTPPPPTPPPRTSSSARTYVPGAGRAPLRLRAGLVPGRR